MSCSPIRSDTSTGTANKTAVITGGASGMGRVFALRMIQEGFQLAVIDQSQNALNELAAEVQALGLERFLHCHCLDVRDNEALRLLASQHSEQFGAIDRLVTCAAIMPTSGLAQQQADQINQIMNINYGGTVNAVAAVLPQMLARDRGEVIVFGSSGGYLPVPECGAYVASKFATNIYLETLMEENRNANVQFMLVCPPLVDTPLLQQAVDSSNPKMIQDAIRDKRFVSPDYIIDQVEAGIRSGKKILIPGAATKLMVWLRRFSPRMLWKFIHLAE